MNDTFSAIFTCDLRNQLYLSAALSAEVHM